MNCNASCGKDNADVGGGGAPRRSRRPAIRVAHPPADRPLLIFDGDCGFCRRWVERGRRILGDRLDFEPSQAVAGEYPEIPAEEFQRGVQFIQPDGWVWGHAAGALRALALRPGWGWVTTAYERVPGIAWLAEALYRLVATNRGFFSRVDRRLSRK